MTTFLLRRTLEGLKVQIFAYGLGIAAFIALIVLITPGISSELEDVSYPEGFEAFFGTIDFSDPRNFISVEVMTVGPLVLSIFAITVGTGTLAGEEGRGTIEILLAQPLTRRSIFVQKAAGIWAATALICLLACVGFLASVPFVDLGEDVDAVAMILSPLSWLPFLSVCIALSLVLGAIAPSRGQAAAFAAAFVVLAYLSSSIAEATDALSWLRYTSAFYYSDTQQVLTAGVVVWHQVLLAAVAIFAAFLALRGFEGREMYSGRWQVSLV